MKRALLLLFLPAIAGLLGATSADAAEQPAQDYSKSRLVVRMMAFDANHDGKLTRDELTDARLHRLFEQADVEHKGYVTADDLAKLAAKLDAETADNGRQDRFDGPGPGFGTPPTPGQIIPPWARERLKLTTEQSAQIDDLQKQVDRRLASILTEGQMKQLHSPGRPGGGPPSR